MKTLEKSKKHISEAINSKRFLPVAKPAFYFITGFILSRNFVLDSASPFAISLISVSGKRKYFYSAAGAALGYLLFCQENLARYWAAVVIALLGALAIELSDSYSFSFASMLLAFLSLFSTGAVVNLHSSAPFSAYALSFAEGILSAGGAFFFHRTIFSSFKRIRFKALPASDLTCIIISALIIMMSLAKINIHGVSPIRAAALMMILATIRYGSDKLGIILALSVGFAFGIGESETMFLIGAYGFSALLACLFSPFGPFAAALSFSLSCALFSVASQAGISYIIEAGIASVLIVLIPEALSRKLEAFFHNGSDITPDGSLRQSLVMRLRFASSAMNYISESVNEVRERISSINSQRDELRKQQQTELEYISGRIINEKTNEIRMVAADQFFSISDMLSDLAAEFDEAEHFDNIAAGKLRRVLGEYEIYPKSISVIEDKFGRVRIEILTEKSAAAFRNPSLEKEVSKACGRYFDKCRITQFQNDAIVSFSEKPRFSLSIGFAQHSAEGKLCGDTIKTVNDGRGNSILIISDGMGRGSRAALDGAMGAGLLSRLLSAGFGFDSALKVVNSALLVKSNDESLATLDCASIDLFTGKVDLYKAGAPASYIVKGNRVTKCELSSMPAGILRGIEFAKRTAVLSDGDLIVLASDGITDLGTEWLYALLTGFEDAAPQEVADTILKEALNISKDIKEDDMSIITARLKNI